MKVATWNVNGIRARFADVTAWSDRDRPDVFCLQEIKATAAQVPEPLTGLPDYHSFWHGGPGGYSGVSLHVRRDLANRSPRFAIPPFDMEHRVAAVELEELTVATLYVPMATRATRTRSPSSMACVAGRSSCAKRSAPPSSAAISTSPAATRTFTPPRGSAA